MLPLDWYPDWWLQHPVYAFLAGFGAGRLIVPTLLHMAVTALEVAATRVLVKQPGKAGKNARTAMTVVLFGHGLVWLMTLAALDMYVSYFYSPAMFALVALFVASRAMNVQRQRAKGDSRTGPLPLA